MNKEAQKEKIEPQFKVDTKEADKNRKLGDAEIKTSCLTCKFKSNCHDAIAYFSLAADSYKAAQKFNDEIYCREKLIFCFQREKSLWEEANEHMKLALVYLTHLKKYDIVIKAVNNCYQCFFENGDYLDAFNAISSIGEKFIDINEIQNAEDCYRIGFDCFVRVFHVIATKKDLPTLSLYNSLYQYFNILTRNNKIKSAIESCQSAIKTIEKFEEDKSKIVEIYALLLIYFLLNNDLIEFNKQIDAARRHCEKGSDLRFLQDIESIPGDIEKSQEPQFKNHTVDVKVRFPNEIYKRLYALFNERKLNQGANVVTWDLDRFNKFIENNNNDEKDVIVNDENQAINEYL
jgi:hypothetical protein